MEQDDFTESLYAFLTFFYVMENTYNDSIFYEGYTSEKFDRYINLGVNEISNDFRVYPRKIYKDMTRDYKSAHKIEYQNRLTFKYFGDLDSKYFRVVCAVIEFHTNRIFEDYKIINFFNKYFIGDLSDIRSNSIVYNYLSDGISPNGYELQGLHISQQKIINKLFNSNYIDKFKEVLKIKILTE